MFPFGDLNGDYTVDSADDAIFRDLVADEKYCLLADVNLDGDVNTTDGSILLAFYLGRTGGVDVLSTAEVANEIGYAGYLWNAERGQWHVRNRELAPKLGRWLQRDPIGYDRRIGECVRVCVQPSDFGVRSNRALAGAGLGTGLGWRKSLRRWRMR